MNEAIPSPVKGAPMRADWAARITDVCNQMVTSGMAGTLVRDGAGAFGNAPLSGNQRNRTTRTPLPFQVAWRTDVGESGGLAVYLPTDHLLMVDGTYVSIGGVTSINGVPDWFAIDDGNRDAAHVWLLVSKGSDQVGASVTCAESPEGDLCICLAEVVQPASESTDRPPTVRQSVWAPSSSAWAAKEDQETCPHPGLSSRLSTRSRPRRTRTMRITPMTSESSAAGSHMMPRPVRSP